VSLTYYVYGLVCPTSGKVHYVGLSRQPAARFYQHLSGAMNPSNDKDRWIASVLEEGREPELLILQIIAYQPVEGKKGYWHSDVDRKEAEREWTRRLHGAGHPLTNKHIPTQKPTEEDLLSRAAERGREFVAALED
jgi:hypothetical protein